MSALRKVNDTSSQVARKARAYGRHDFLLIPVVHATPGLEAVQIGLRPLQMPLSRLVGHTIGGAAHHGPSRIVAERCFVFEDKPPVETVPDLGPLAFAPMAHFSHVIGA